MSSVATTLTLVQGQLGLDLSGAAVCHSADMQGAFRVASWCLFPGCHQQGQESSVNIYPSHFAALLVGESPHCSGMDATFPPGAGWLGEN